MSNPEEKREWVRVAEEYEASGLTQREFAEQRGLRLSTLQSWVYRRRRQVSTAPAVPLRLLPVQVTAAPVVRATLELVLPSGVRLSLEVGTEVQYVAHLVAALEKRAC